MSGPLWWGWRVAERNLSWAGTGPPRRGGPCGARLGAGATGWHELLLSLRLRWSLRQW